MKTVIINGQNHKGSTYHIGRLLADKNNGKVKPGIKTKVFFSVMRMLQSKGGLLKPDAEYWKKMGWTGKERPWK